MSNQASKGYTSSARLSIPVSAYYIVETSDWGVLQPAIPTGEFNETQENWYVQVPNTFRIQKPVFYANPGQALQNPGVVVGQFQCIAPIDPGRSTSVTSGSNTYWYLNGYLFLVTGSGTTAASVPATMANPANQEPGTAAYVKNATVTDGTATWTCQGRQILIVASVVFGDTSPIEGPVAQEYDFFQL